MKRATNHFAASRKALSISPLSFPSGTLIADSPGDDPEAARRFYPSNFCANLPPISNGLTYRITLGAADRTLTSEEVAAIREQILNHEYNSRSTL